MILPLHSIFSLCRRCDRRVDYYQSHVLTLLLYWADAQKSSTISTSYRALSAELGMAPDTARNAIRKLEERGFVRREVMPRAEINGITYYNNLNIIINYAAIEAAVTGVPLSDTSTPSNTEKTTETPAAEPSPTVEPDQGGRGLSHPHINNNYIYHFNSARHARPKKETPPPLTDAEIERLCGEYDPDIVSSTVARAATYRGCYTYTVVALWCSEAQARRRAWQHKRRDRALARTRTGTRYPRHSTAQWAPTEQHDYDFVALEQELAAY